MWKHLIISIQIVQIICYFVIIIMIPTRFNLNRILFEIRISGYLYLLFLRNIRQLFIEYKLFSLNIDSTMNLIILLIIE